MNETTPTTHRIYNLTETAKLLGRSTGYLSAVKRVMGMRDKRVFDDADVAAIKQWLKDHPEFRTAHAYAANT